MLNRNKQLKSRVNIDIYEKLKGYAEKKGCTMSYAIFDILTYFFNGVPAEATTANEREKNKKACSWLYL